ncbi:MULTISPECIES: D-ribose pyranase [Streptomyces]|uniref:D-ribose pyranase n=1 Tax=Streptomyces rutgersensis TaxID=53451 RepID=A0ABX6RVG5_9ACTN|nr:MULTISPECIES: D-ribose pyranase [Streptomyces]WSU34338.1 D-ribose pyranase [Streptomyces gougerotii]MBL3808421.1 D-ribose pyranase [Streptomyces sp. BRB081]MDQ0297562.1 simple sugar transport system permease protein/D-ribose pyranase [Streptomyces sp. DSM 41037]QNE84560.1 D-ribose pyranase [Streptomyces rutgersensis]RPK78906.1 D-ribose pyranase [Streptomyces sp. ADI98-12]
MKRSGILNAELSGALATLGHTDLLLVVDAGFPVPRDAHRVDLALAQNLPDLRTVLALIADELVVEGVVRAENVPHNNPRLDTWLHERFTDAEFTTRPHTEMLGALARQAKVIVRTGAFEPWGNIGLYCGVDAPHWFGGEDIITPPEYASRL